VRTTSRNRKLLEGAAVLAFGASTSLASYRAISMNEKLEGNLRNNNKYHELTIRKEDLDKEIMQIRV